MSDITENFTLPSNGYLAFDATSFKSLLKQRLTNVGVFTDQNYEGSNIAQLVDMFAYTFHTLIYYMNRTASEGLFSDARLYENLNRIVKTIGYNPIGRQTSVLSFDVLARGGLEVGLYLIPRYSYLSVGSVMYSLKEDIPFKKETSVDDESVLSGSTNQYLLYQGEYKEYVTQVAIGEDGELMFLNPGEDVNIDHFTIDVYVKDASTGKWSAWEKTPSLYLNNATSKAYEIRLNERMYYEIKFGNNINGQRLNAGDQVAIYYIASNGVSGVVGANALENASMVLFSGDQYDAIMADVRDNPPTILDYATVALLSFSNDSSSTYYTPEEDVDSIRTNAPGIYRSQYRLVTAEDFTSYIGTNYANFVHDVKVVNNWAYLSGYLKYFYDRGLMSPNNDGRVMLNQVMFGDACNFNNVYIFTVPKIATDDQETAYLTPALKSVIIQSMSNVKLLTCEPVLLDPMYLAVGFALPLPGKSLVVDDIGNTELYVVRKYNSRRDNASIQNDIYTLLSDYFSLGRCSLGQTIDVSQLTSDMLAIDGVETVYTRRIDDNTVRLEGLAFARYNPVYPTDVVSVTNNLKLEDFQFPYWHSIATLTDKINVQTTRLMYEEVEY